MIGAERSHYFAAMRWYSQQWTAPYDAGQPTSGSHPEVCVIVVAAESRRCKCRDNHFLFFFVFFFQSWVTLELTLLASNVVDLLNGGSCCQETSCFQASVLESLRRDGSHFGHVYLPRAWSYSQLLL
jgi:hypothetical protein